MMFLLSYLHNGMSLQTRKAECEGDQSFSINHQFGRNRKLNSE